MSDTKIFPAMCRRNLVPDDLHRRIQDFLTRGADFGVFAVTLLIFHDHNQNFHTLGGVRFIAQNGGAIRHASAVRDELPEVLHQDARDIALEITDTHGVAGDLEDVDADYLMFPNAGNYNAMFMLGCTLVAADDPSARFQSDAHDILKEPEKLRNRAPIFTLILNEVGSHHERAAQPPMVLDSIDKWLGVNGFVPGIGLPMDMGICLTPPTQVDIMSCDDDCIEIKHPDEA